MLRRVLYISELSVPSARRCRKQLQVPDGITPPLQHSIGPHSDLLNRPCRLPYRTAVRILSIGGSSDALSSPRSGLFKVGIRVTTSES
jgi:hypothetical protein